VTPIGDDILERILRLKRERNAVLLVHNYQLPEIQDIADFTGDSLGLSRQAAKTDADVIVFCGVHFMAETAAILCPRKTVLLPVLEAGCPMAQMITAEQLRQKKQEHPDAAVVCYVNTSAEVKAESDYCCTSANAVQVVERVDAEEVLFVPDVSLGAWVAGQTSKKVILWPGFCPTHHRILAEDVARLKAEHPQAEVLVHPECTQDVIALADHVLSTTGILKRAAASPAREFIIGTENGILYRLEKDNPGKTFYEVSDRVVCPNMKRTHLEDVLWALQDMRHRITVPEDVRRRALRAIERMVAIG
jgi:quinolinate synthase